MKSSSRGGAVVRNLAVHTTEGVMRVSDLRAFFERGGKSSSHASVDETGALADGAADGFVDYRQAAWTIRNGNAWTDNLEVCGRAGWTRAQWMSRPKLLEGVAVWLARRSKARALPLNRLTVPQLRAQWRGVIDHDDYSKATGDGTHWDVGENFPWDVVLPRAQQLAGGVPAPAPIPKKKRRRTMYLTSDLSQTAYVVDPSVGLRVLYTVEEVNCIAWLVNDSRSTDAVLHQNDRFHDVLIQVLSRPAIKQRPRPKTAVAQLLTAGAGPVELFEATGYATEAEPWGPPAPVDDPDAIAPPPGFAAYDPHAPGHD